MIVGGVGLTGIMTMDKVKRQKRIIQKKRNLKKWLKREHTKKILWSTFPDKPTTLTDEDRLRASINANHGKRCSCNGCGNQRRAFGRNNLTQQEKKEECRYNDWFDGF